jgi:hypothetical protein
MRAAISIRSECGHSGARMPPRPFKPFERWPNGWTSSLHLDALADLKRVNSQTGRGGRHIRPTTERGHDQKFDTFERFYAHSEVLHSALP